MQAEADLQFYKALFNLADQSSTVAWVLCKDPGMPLILSTFSKQVFGEQIHFNDIRAQVIETVHVDDRPQALNRLNEVERTGRLTQMRVRIMRVDTRDYGWFDCSFAALSRDRGRVTRWAFRAVDIDAEVRSQQAAREASQRKDAFIALLGHELRNPLAPIINSLALIRSNHPSEAILHEVELIERQTRHMVRLINDLLDVSRLDYDRLTLAPERIDLRMTLKQVRESILRAHVSMHKRLTLIEPDQPVMVMADRARIGQVVGNLMRNAVSFSPPGSPVTLSLSVTAEQEARIDLTDTGIGIEPKRLATLFEPFSRPPETVRHAGEGLGLGLSLAQRLVQMQGGRLSVHSPGAGLGSTFTIHLPLAAQTDEAVDTPPQAINPSQSATPAQSATPPQPVAVAAPATPAAGHPASILVVDDNVKAADSLTRLLRLWGHSARAAHDGPSGLDLWQTLHPDVVLLDISMPGMSGVELARLLRAQQGGRSLRIFAVSGFPASDETDPKDQPLFDRYLVKPVDLDLLRHLLESPSDEPAPR